MKQTHILPWIPNLTPLSLYHSLFSLIGAVRSPLSRDSSHRCLLAVAVVAPSSLRSSAALAVTPTSPGAVASLQTSRRRLCQTRTGHRVSGQPCRCPARPAPIRPCPAVPTSINGVMMRGYGV
ncbi:hypothetical protein AAHA92_14122 [Salvia divinorum]|uniref:Uncharacterized protein n=1 Tax=Salvia divinorum TaxID=28513 RepID=A0ABD1HBW3_SALDI